MNSSAIAAKLRELADLIDAPDPTPVLKKVDGVYTEGDEVFVWSLQSNFGGGFLQGVPAKIMLVRSHGIYVGVQRNVQGGWDPSYLVYPEQISHWRNPPGKVCYPYRKGQKVLVYSAQSWSDRGFPRGSIGKVKQDQIGPAVLLETNDEYTSFEVYAEQLRPYK